MNRLSHKAIHPLSLVGLVVFCVVCQVVAAPTKDAGGAEGVVSWIAFVGFWVGAVAFLVLAVALAARTVATRRA